MASNISKAMNAGNNESPSWKPTVDMKTTVNTGRLIGLATLGTVIGATAGFLFNFLDFKQKTRQLKGISVKYMPKYNPDVLEIFYTLQNSVFDICPQQYKDTYKQHILYAIQNAECIFLLENVSSNYIGNDEIPQNILFRALIHHKYCSKALKNILPFFQTKNLKSVTEYIDFIIDTLREHLQNMDNMGMDLYFNM
jgi:hypothetical protein